MSNLKNTPKPVFDVLNDKLLFHQHEIPITAAEKLSWDNDSLRCSLNGQGFVITAGSFIDISVWFAGTLTGWTLLNTARIGATDQISIAVRRCTYAQYDGGVTHPAAGDKISALTPITMASAGDYKNTDAVLAGWDKTLSAGDILRLYVSTAAAITNATIILSVSKG